MFVRFLHFARCGAELPAILAAGNFVKAKGFLRNRWAAVSTCLLCAAIESRTRTSFGRHKDMEGFVGGKNLGSVETSSNVSGSHVMTNNNAGHFPWCRKAGGAHCAGWPYAMRQKQKCFSCKEIGELLSWPGARHGSRECVLHGNHDDMGILGSEETHFQKFTHAQTFHVAV